MIYQVLALCYDLEKEMNGTGHLRTEPYQQLHTSDVTGKPLFVCKRSHRPKAAVGATIQTVADAIRDLLVAQYGLRDQVCTNAHYTNANANAHASANANANAHANALAYGLAFCFVFVCWCRSGSLGGPGVFAQRMIHNKLYQDLF